MAFLFDFEEIEHTTVLGLTLQDIIRDAKHRLRPWELEKKRKIRGLKKAVVPNLGYSQIYCYYRYSIENCEIFREISLPLVTVGCCRST